MYNRYKHLLTKMSKSKFRIKNKEKKILKKEYIQWNSF